jgi:hypothetical protein
MRRAWAIALLLSGCDRSPPIWTLPPPAPAPVALNLRGRPDTIVSIERYAPTPKGTVSLSCRQIRDDAIPVVSQTAPNDCGTAALATLLGFYGLKAGQGDPLQAMKTALPPQPWGTDIRAAVAYLNGTGALGAASYRQGELDPLIETALGGRPIPVVLTLPDRPLEMHWQLIVGRGMTPDGQEYVLVKNPSNLEPLALVPVKAETFRLEWQNDDLRTASWAQVVGVAGQFNPADYERPWIDVGLKPR